ncbi:hypothetical protein DPMN_024355 [Dreissena polymorpha]|uniref:Uncharacterized protein n=1 Tax=Dreissena polymorpha TaxID=45954 RepID=A0A9D4LMF1_DREPO|nr:hypothetical protein DPMN_024355 [Dreissena polymorpha]
MKIFFNVCATCVPTGIFIASVGVGQSTSKVDMEVLAFNPELGFMMPNWGRVIITPPMDANIVARE